MTPGTLDFGSYKKGDTLIPKTIQLQTSDGGTPPVLTPIDLTGVVITIMFKTDYTASSALTLSTINGKITLSDPADGKFSILPVILNMDPGLYYHDIEFKFVDGQVRTYLTGTLYIEPDYTN